MSTSPAPAATNTIALVDDDRNILASVSMALEAEGFKVNTYNDGEEGLKGNHRQSAGPCGSGH